MGWNSRIMTIGKHEPGAEKFYDYPESWYRGIKTGAEVVSFPVQAETTRQSELLADCVGVDKNDFSTHSINKVDVDIIDINNVFGTEGATALMSLLTLGHKAYFIPEC